VNVAVNPHVRSGFEHRFFMAALIGIFAVVVIGFAKTYYLKVAFGTPALPWLVHLHGALMTSWFLLFFTQACLISTHRAHWHRRLGVFGALLALAIVVIGPIVLMHATERAARAARRPVLHRDLRGRSGDPDRFRDPGRKRHLVAPAQRLAQAADAARHVQHPPAGHLAHSHQRIGQLRSVLCLRAGAGGRRRHAPSPRAFGWGAPLLIASQTLSFFGATTHAWRDFVMRLFA
jgi:hypothetical protein